jgi:hypothetical protein
MPNYQPVENVVSEGPAIVDLQRVFDALAAHNADPTAHGGALMPTFISEVFQTAAGGGGVSVNTLIPATAKHVVVLFAVHGACVPSDLEVTVLHAPADAGCRWKGDTMPSGAMMDLPNACAGGGVPDTVIAKNNAAALAGNDIEVWWRVYK